MARKPKDVLPGAVSRAKKLAYKIGDDVWVKAKVTPPSYGRQNFTASPPARIT